MYNLWTKLMWEVNERGNMIDIFKSEWQPPHVLPCQSSCWAPGSRPVSHCHRSSSSPGSGHSCPPRPPRTSPRPPPPGSSLSSHRSVRIAEETSCHCYHCIQDNWITLKNWNFISVKVILNSITKRIINTKWKNQ